MHGGITCAWRSFLSVYVFRVNKVANVKTKAKDKCLSFNKEVFVIIRFDMVVVLFSERGEPV
jgi:hypothetical protein